MLALRHATADDASWIHEAYSAIGFLSSDPSEHFVIVAEIDGERAGLGRLVPAGEDACELGGMLVFEQFRGRGIARAIIDELLHNAGTREVYCVPFAELEPIYAASGFVTQASDDEAPEEIRRKLAWCAREIPERRVLLMKMR